MWQNHVQNIKAKCQYINVITNVMYWHLTVISYTWLYHILYDDMYNYVNTFYFPLWSSVLEDGLFKLKHAGE